MTKAYFKDKGFVEINAFVQEIIHKANAMSAKRKTETHISPFENASTSSSSSLGNDQAFIDKMNADHAISILAVEQSLKEFEILDTSMQSQKQEQEQEQKQKQEEEEEEEQEEEQEEFVVPTTKFYEAKASSFMSVLESTDDLNKVINVKSKDRIWVILTAQGNVIKGNSDQIKTVVNNLGIPFKDLKKSTKIGMVGSNDRGSLYLLHKKTLATALGGGGCDLVVIFFTCRGSV